MGALLAQNTNLYVSPTSELINVLVQARNTWTTLDGFRAQGVQALKPRISNMLAGIMQGFYRNELSMGMSIIDKNRAWPAYIELVEEILQREIRIICPIRDLKDIVASFEMLRRENPLTAPHGVDADYIQQQTMLGRAQNLLSPSGVVGIAIRRMIDANERGLRSRLIYVDFKKFMAQPSQTVAMLQLELGLDPVAADLENIEASDDVSRDYDVWGLPLHKVRKTIKSPLKQWQDVLTREVGDWIDSQFPPG